MNENWGAEEWRQPATEEGDTVLFSEHGRIIGNVDHRSHWFKLVKSEFGPICLLVKHGGGEERVRLDYKAGNLASILKDVQPDERYLVFSTLLNLYHDTGRQAREQTASKYQLAFLEGRLKRRKRDHRYYCEIQTKVQNA